MTVMVVFETYDEVTKELESRRQLDHDNQEHRKWMGRHSYWAMRNGRMIISYPMTTAQKAEIAPIPYDNDDESTVEVCENA